jgi:hypothetical protein
VDQNSSSSKDADKKLSSVGPLLVGAIILFGSLAMVIGSVTYIVSQFTNSAGSFGAGGSVSLTGMEAQIQAVSRDLRDSLQSTRDLEELKKSVTSSESLGVIKNNPSVFSIYVTYASAGSNIVYLVKTKSLTPMRNRDKAGVPKTIGDPPMVVQDMTFENSNGEPESGRSYVTRIKNGERHATIVFTVHVRRGQP